LLKRGKRINEKCGKRCSGSFCKFHKSKELPIKKKEETIISNFDTLETLKFKLKTLDTIPQNRAIITKRLKYIELIPITSTEYQKNINWLRHALNFPYNVIKTIPIDMNTPINEISNYISGVYKKLDNYIYGMQSIKEELISFVCKRISNPFSNNHILSLQGNNGVGKTRLAHGLAEALDLPIKTINLGCISDVTYLTGHNFTYVDSEPGRIVQILNETRYKNCIIYFDELDKVHQTSKGQSINSFLTHLIDNTQNKKYQDVYLSGIELDLSNVFFVFSFNDINLIDKTVRDRLNVIKIKTHSIEDSIEICQKFIIPEICKNLNYSIEIPKDTIRKVVVQYHSNNEGLRPIKRVFDSILSKLNVLRMLNISEQERLSFYDPDLSRCIENILRTEESATDQQHLSFYM